ncbi:lytic transglycosylase domain-containing protein [Marinicrinis sediminis]|uniref:Lytic transglycosylase domain-containing protein n=1 Tax=Marinicrinis sediminis TaxID=1652465 RepID=A0ABW5RF43_9BACL
MKRTRKGYTKIFRSAMIELKMKVWVEPLRISEQAMQQAKQVLPLSASAVSSPLSMPDPGQWETGFAAELEKLLFAGSASKRIIPAESALLMLKHKNGWEGSFNMEMPELSSALPVPATTTFHTPASASYDEMIEEASQRYGLSSSLIRAVIQTESGYQAYATSSAGAKGLMQLMDATARELGVQDPYDPYENIMGGSKYLAALLRKYHGEEMVALAAYNAGPGRVDRLGIQTDEEVRQKMHLLPSETQQYVQKVSRIAGSVSSI